MLCACYTQTITFGLRKCDTSVFSFAGGIFYYNVILLQGSLWWIFHVSVLFYGIQFPFHSRSFKVRTKYIHVIMVVVALLLPLGACNNLWSYIGGYTMTVFPPILCTGSDADATFYSLLLSIIIILGTGTRLLVIMFWKIHMVHITHLFPLSQPAPMIMVQSQWEGIML